MIRTFLKLVVVAAVLLVCGGLLMKGCFNSLDRDAKNSAAVRALQQQVADERAYLDWVKANP